QAYITDHKGQLLTDEAEEALRQMLEEDPENRAIENHIILLEACRNEGIESAYTRLTTRADDDGALRLLSALIAADNRGKMQKLVLEWPDVLLDMAQQLAERTLTQVEGEIADVLRDRLGMLETVRSETDTSDKLTLEQHTLFEAFLLTQNSQQMR